MTTREALLEQALQRLLDATAWFDDVAPEFAFDAIDGYQLVGGTRLPLKRFAAALEARDAAADVLAEGFPAALV